MHCLTGYGFLTTSKRREEGWYLTSSTPGSEREPERV